MSDPLAPIRADANAIISTSILFIALTGSVVAMRIISRPIFGIKYGLEDWFVLAGAVLFWTNGGLQIASIISARKATSVYDPHYSDYNKYIYIGGDLYFPCVFFVNLSILCLYRRLFTTPSFKTFTSVIIGINTAWFITGFIVEVFACWPVAMFWDFTVPGKCIYYSTFWLIIGIAELFMDVIFFIMPLHQITRLQLKSSQKMLLAMVFALGGLSIITGICRLAQGYIHHNSYVNLVKDSLWLNIHLGTSILCACLPTMRTLVARVTTSVSSFRSNYGSDGSKGYSSKPRGANNSNTPRSYDETYQKIKYSQDTMEMGNTQSVTDSDSREANRPMRVPREVV